MTIKLTKATLFLYSLFTPSLKNVEEGRICTIYSFSLAEAGLNMSRSTWKVKNFFFIIQPSLF